VSPFLKPPFYTWPTLYKQHSDVSLHLMFQRFSRNDLVQLVTSCLDSDNEAVVLGAIRAASALVSVYGDSMLQYMSDSTESKSFIETLLKCAAGNQRKAMHSHADSLLWYAFKQRP